MYFIKMFRYLLSDLVWLFVILIITFCQDYICPQMSPLSFLLITVKVYDGLMALKSNVTITFC